MSYGIQPVPTAARKLIYDESTENMYVWYPICQI